jgi:predicted transcriptional regulator
VERAAQELKNSCKFKLKKMGALLIREKLQEYIKTADDKKVKAIFTMLETEIETNAWWKDESLIKKFDKEYDNYVSGKDKAYSLEEVIVHFNKKKKILSKV